jgi:hypothetical protein
MDRRTTFIPRRGGSDEIAATTFAASAQTGNKKTVRRIGQLTDRFLPESPAETLEFAAPLRALGWWRAGILLD